MSFLPEIASGGGNISSFLANSPYGRSITPSENVDRSSILWRDFLGGVQRRKRLIKHLRDIALDDETPNSLLKAKMLELRQLTLRVIEDALEIEYRHQIQGSRSTSRHSSNKSSLPPISTFQGMGKKEDLFVLAEMINDTDEILKVSSIRVFLPENFPGKRNPFMFGKSVDELVSIAPPQPEAGNVQDELRVLELLRYKRAAKALLNAEIQLLNKLPISLLDVENLFDRLGEHPNLDKLLRAVCTLLDDENLADHINGPANLTYLTEDSFYVEPTEFLMKMNLFQLGRSLRVDVQASVRQFLRGTPLSQIEDPVAIFLIEWVNAVIGQVTVSKVGDEAGQGQGKGLGQGLGQYLQQPTSSTSSFLPTLTAGGSRTGTAESVDYFSRTIQSPLYTGTGTAELNVAPVGVLSNADAAAGFDDLLVSNAPNKRRGGGADEVLVSSRIGTPKEGGTSRLGTPRITMPNKLSPPKPPDESTSRKRVSYAEDGVLAADNGVEAPNSVESLGGGSSLSSGGMIKKKALEEMQIKEEGLKRHVEKQKGGALSKRIQAEVDRLLKLHGIGTNRGASGANKNDDEEDVLEPEKLSAVRYELLKLQQELMRRGVLDPRSYSALSIDTLFDDRDNAEKIAPELAMQSRKSAMVAANLVGSPMRGSKAAGAKGGAAGGTKIPPGAVLTTNRKGEPQIKLMEREAYFCDGDKGMVVLVYDVATKFLVGKIERLIEPLNESSPENKGVAEDKEEKNNSNSTKDGNRQQMMLLLAEKNGPEKRAKEPIRQTMAYMRIPGLFANKLTGYTLEAIIEARPVEQKRILDPIVHQLCERAALTPPPRGRLAPRVDRSIYEQDISPSGVAAHLEIVRDDDCQGMTIKCTPMPLPGLIQLDVIGTIVLAVPDRELQVLLIDQKGLYDLAMKKWSAIESVARWLVTRVRLTRSHPALLEGGLGTSTIGTTSISARGSPNKREIATAGDPGSQSFSRSLLMTAGGGGRSASSDAAADHSQDRDLGAIELSLDRTIDILKTVEQQWRRRNVFMLPGLKITISAWQDLEMLVIQVILTIPHAKVRQAKSLELIDYSTYDGDRYYEEIEELDVSELTPTVIDLSYRLTSGEIAVFGELDQVNVPKVVLETSSKDEEHPAMFMWNLLSRLQVEFKARKSDPFGKTSAVEDPSKWVMRYDRVLLKEVRKLSQSAAVVSVSALGSGLLFEAQSVQAANSSDKQVKIGGKTMDDQELASFAAEEGWPPDILEYSRRAQLGKLILNHLKIIEERGEKRIELNNYPESRLITVYQQATKTLPEITLGVIEINNHMSLKDLRTVINIEFEKSSLPRFYRFIYKGAICAQKQEGFRKAWECLPRCAIAPVKQNDETAISQSGLNLSPEEILKRAEEEKSKKLKEEELNKVQSGKRRINPDLIPVPVPTLCRIQEQSGEIFLLDDPANIMLTPGDIIRFGSALGRDYIVLRRNKIVEENYPRTMYIDPMYEVDEAVDDMPFLTGNYVYPEDGVAGTLLAPSGVRKILDFPEELGHEYLIAGRKTDILEAEKKAEEAVKQAEVDALTRYRSGKDRVKTSQLEPPSPAAAAAAADAKKSSAAVEKEDDDDDDEIGKVFSDVWVWKCVRPEEDTRPRWRQMFDDGKIKYQYTFSESIKVMRKFKVKIAFSLLEVYCTDVRCAHLARTRYTQRVDELASLTADKATDIAYRAICAWYPQKDMIESSKFLRCLTGMKIFPDMRRGARQAQMDELFKKQCREDSNARGKALALDGFRILLREIGLVRFPPPKKDPVLRQATEEIEDDDISSKLLAADDNSVGGSSLGGLSVAASVASTVNRKQGGRRVSQSPSRMQERGIKGIRQRINSSSSGKAAADSDNISVGSTRTGGVASVASRKKSTATLALAYAKNKLKGGRKGQKGIPEDEVEEGAVQIDPQHLDYVYKKVVFDYLMSVGGLAAAFWEEAKMMAMKKEGVRYCAATRIAAWGRCKLWRWRFREFIRTFVKLQANIRRKLACRRVRRILRSLIEDWTFRQRYHAATIVNSIVRMFLRRCDHYRAIQKLLKDQIQVQKARRFAMKKRRAKQRKAVLLREVRRITGIMAVIVIRRLDLRHYSKDCGVVVEVYVPTYQLLHKFPIEEPVLRKYMQALLDVPAVTIGDLTDKRYLREIIGSRLIMKPPHDTVMLPQIRFSRQAHGHRGTKLMVHGRRIGRETFVCTVYETGSDITVACYHQVSGGIFHAEILRSTLYDWYKREYLDGCQSEYEKTLDPPLLRADSKKGLMKWAINRLMIDTRRGKFKVLFACQYERSKKFNSLVILQSFWRRLLARYRVLRILDSYMVKVCSVPGDFSSCYYVNRSNGTSTWEKPTLLRQGDLLSQPIHTWIACHYQHEGEWFTHYVNPWTGKYVNYSMERAAGIIQSLARTYLLRIYLLPMSELSKVVRITATAEATYRESNKRLASVINYALTLQVVNLDESPKTHRIYDEAVELSAASPLVCRALALFQIGILQAPMQVTRERGLKELLNSHRRDENHSKFLTALSFYKYACLRHPHDYRSLLNLALVYLLVFEDISLGERIMRRVVSMDPFQDRVIELWRFFKDRFPERHGLYNLQSRVEMIESARLGKKRTLHGRVVTDNPAWAGWVFVNEIDNRSMIYSSRQSRSRKGNRRAALKGIENMTVSESYWYNPADGAETWNQPDFAAEWQVRIKRSMYQSSEGSLELYWDPLTNMHFNFHPVSSTYA